MQQRNDPPIEVLTAPDANASIIWLHGLGADGSDFVSVVPELGLPASLRVRFIFPHAPHRPVTLNNGYVMRAWYDLAWNERGFKQDASHIEESIRAIHALIEHEHARGIPFKRIVVAGFSQGGVMALHSALRFPQALAGAVILSAPAVYTDELTAEVAAPNAQLPLFLAHGRNDPLVSFALGEQMRDVLKARNFPIEWHEYDMEHSVCWEEIGAIGKFLARVLVG